MGEVVKPARQAPARHPVAPPRRGGAAPGAKTPQGPPPPCGKDRLEISEPCRKAIDLAASGSEAARTVVRDGGTAMGADGAASARLVPGPAAKERELPVLSRDQLDQLLAGKEYYLYPNPGFGGVITDFRVVGYAIDEDEWNRMGRPEGFVPIAYLRTHLEIGPIGGDIRIRAKNKDGTRKVSVDVKDPTWHGEKIEKLAKDWALRWAKEHPEQAIPAAVVVVAGGLVGAYYYSKKTGPIEFSVGSIKLLDYKNFEVKAKLKAEVDADPLSARVNGVEGKVEYKFPDDRGRIEAGGRYNFLEDRWRLEANYGFSIGKEGRPDRPHGYFGVGCWAEQAHGRLGRDRDWDYGAGVFLGVRF